MHATQLRASSRRCLACSQLTTRSWRLRPSRAPAELGCGAAAPSLPLEILQLNSFEPTYRARLEVNQGELPVLPLSIYGAVAMSHAPESLDGESSANAFFLHKFVRSSSGLAGLSFDEGNFSVVGYVTEGIEFLQQIQPGDMIKSARLVSGADKLIVPA